MTIIRIFSSACVVSAFLLIGIRSSADEPNGETKALKSGAIGLVASNRGIRVATPETFAKGGARLVKKNGIVLGILVPPASTAETCPIEVLLANRGKEKFRCGETGYLLDCILKLQTKQGAEVPYSRRGAYLFKNEAGFTQYAYRKYEPFEIMRWRYDLVNAFTPLKAGEYLLSLETTVWFWDSETNESSKPVKVVAKDIPFTITGKNRREN